MVLVCSLHVLQAKEGVLRSASSPGMFGVKSCWLHVIKVGDDDEQTQYKIPHKFKEFQQLLFCAIQQM